MEKLNVYMQGFHSRDVFHAASLHKLYKCWGLGSGGLGGLATQSLSDISILSNSLPWKFLLLAKMSQMNWNFPLLATLIYKYIIKQHSTFNRQL